MKKIILIFVALFLLTVLFKNACSEENEQGQNTDYMQKYYEKFYKDQQEELKKVKEFEPTTPFSKFMGRFVNSVLIASFIILFVGWITVASSGEEEGFWGTVLKGYTIITVYLLINYCIWFGLKIAKLKYLEELSIIGVILTATLFSYIAFIMFQHKKELRQGTQLPQWNCSSCNAINHYNETCWNCNAPKTVPHPRPARLPTCCSLPK